MEHFWRHLRTYCLESTIIGLKYFYLYPDILSRCFWAINLVAMLTLSCLLTLLLYNRFAEMPTRVTIENQFESVMNLPYPAITICSPNQMTMSSLKYFNRTLVDGNLTIDLQAALPLMLGFYELMTNLDRDKLEHLQDLLEENRYDVPEVMGTMPQSCDSFIKRCYFEGKLIPNCKLLFKPVLTTHGYCCAFNSIYRFNGKKNAKNRSFRNYSVKAVGISNALTIVTDYDPDDAMPGSLLNAGAIRIMYTDWSEFPADDEMSIVDPNGESFNVLYATYTYCSADVKSLPMWSRKCYFEDEHSLPFFQSYHNSDCDHICYVNAVNKACQCFLPYLPHLRAEMSCKLTDIPCILNVKREKTWLSTQECDCPRDCVSRRYRVDLVVGNFDAMPHLIHNPYAGLEFNSSTSIMHFFFTNPVFTKQKQETVMSIISLVSNLGGVFGLFMGCSGISIMEILFYIYIGIKNHLRRRFEMWRRNAPYQ